jgi:hypothetical protein
MDPRQVTPSDNQGATAPAVSAAAAGRPPLVIAEATYPGVFRVIRTAAAEPDREEAQRQDEPPSPTWPRRAEPGSLLKGARRPCMTGDLDRRQEGHQTPGPRVAHAFEPREGTPAAPEANDAPGAARGGDRGGR